MRRYLQGIAFILAVGLALIPVSSASAATRGEAQEMARLIGQLLSAGRVVIERNQALIDDPEKGDKGFTPDVFERQLIDEFRLRSGIDLKNMKEVAIPPMAKDLLQALVASSKSVVADAQDVINRKGVGYKNFIPASFGSQAAARFSAQSHVKLKQTTLQPRNANNTPDDYEQAVLRRLLVQPSQSVTINQVTDDGTLRVLTPIYYTKDCLTCHGSPAGQIDISGYPKEGAEEGDLAGAISVSVPLKEQER
jgi:general secretion pathway protein A